eukprot:COSAG02_NODE_6803_length_3351_cov_17.529520_2_plen_74_part_00
MVKAGSGVCDATIDKSLDGIMCCKTSTVEHEQRIGSSGSKSTMSHENTDETGAGCFTAPTHVRALVWMYTWWK